MPYYRTMVAGRPVVGLGAGLASCIVLFDIGELAPTRIRGRLVTIKVVAVTLGQVVAYGERNPSKGTSLKTNRNWCSVSHVGGGWRWMVGLGATPAVVQLLSLALLPESRKLS
jgi:SP family myo-inositol transporter-like MFS transporter 13